MKLRDRIFQLGQWMEAPSWLGVPRAVYLIPTMLLIITILIGIIIRL